MRLFEFDNDPIHLPDNVATAFSELGNNQRGGPEHAMLKAQAALGGGVLSFVLEHVGDLTHRMSHHAKYGQFYPGNVKDKVEKTLRVLTNGYGFEKENEENLRSNFNYRHEKDPRLTFEKYVAAIDATLAKYAEEHAKLVVYNDVQWQARQAAIWLGKKKFKAAVMSLSRLEDAVRDQQKFAELAAEYTLDDQGNPLPYNP
jgi:hypothetical protein